MIFSRKRTSFFVFLGLLFLGLQSPLYASIKAVFWSKPTLFKQDRLGMASQLGWGTSLTNAHRMFSAQDDFKDGLIKVYGAQTQPYQVNDPETLLPLPNLMRLWLTNEKSARDVRHSANKAFLSLNDPFLAQVADIVFDPQKLIAVTTVIEDSFKLIKRFNANVMHILASNYDSASFKVLKNTPMGKRVLPSFKHVYNSGTLTPPHQGIVLQDPAFFQLIMTDLQLKPEECLVINSDPAVIAAAKKLGMNTIHHAYGDSNSIKKQLKQMKLIK